MTMGVYLVKSLLHASATVVCGITTPSIVTELRMAVLCCVILTPRKYESFGCVQGPAIPKRGQATVCLYLVKGHRSDTL